jgi:DNA-binding transcriptional LysR family regulator
MGLNNAAPDHDRAARLPGGRPRAQLHARRGPARRLPLGAEPCDAPARGADRRAPAHPHDAERSPTEAGERLLRSVGPHFDEIEAALRGLGELRDQPAGTIRINASDHAIETLVWPKLARVLPDYPDIHAELTAETGLVDIVEERFDAGVRIGEQVARDMIAVRIGPDMRMAVVGSPAYCAAHARPSKPQDLAGHECINLRLPTLGGLYAWEFEKRGRELKVRVEGRLIFNRPELMIEAAVNGFGLAFVLEDRAAPHLASGRLVRVLEDWCEPYAGYHLYYPSRRQQSAAFAVIVEALRHRE